MLTPRTAAESAFLSRAVRQDTFGSPRGNCLEACYATLLGVPLAAVPDPRKACAPKADSCARGAIPARTPSIRSWLAREFSLAVVEGRGMPPGVLLAKDAPPLFWIASGLGPRGLNHAVVYGNSRLAWDPHPDDKGLVRVEQYKVLVPIGPLWAVWR